MEGCCKAQLKVNGYLQGERTSTSPCTNGNHNLMHICAVCDLGIGAEKGLCVRAWF